METILTGSADRFSRELPIQVSLTFQPRPVLPCAFQRCLPPPHPCPLLDPPTAFFTWNHAQCRHVNQQLPQGGPRAHELTPQELLVHCQAWVHCTPPWASKQTSRGLGTSRTSHPESQGQCLLSTYYYRCVQKRTKDNPYLMDLMVQKEGKKTM